MKMSGIMDPSTLKDPGPTYICRKNLDPKNPASPPLKYKCINFHKDPYPGRIHKNGSKIPPKIMDTPTLKGPGPTYMCRKNLDPKNPDESNPQIEKYQIS